jgi:tryptophanyl-tRNA synthetase
MKKILSGMRPTGKLHIGHLIGVLANWAKLQDEYECLFEIADWHALTSEYGNAKNIPEYAVEIAADWIASGIDHKKSIIFIQSKVIEHAELHLLLSMITPLSWLERCPTYKEQLNEIKEKDLSNYGFLGYPVLQAADILIYKAETVPIGHDQLPHLELTREIARRFNYLYGDVFPEPNHVFTKIPKVLGIDGRKMSKSYNNCIMISDSPEEIKKKIKISYTDPLKMRLGDVGHPDNCPVFLLQSVYNNNITEIRTGCESGKLGCADCKKILVDKLLNTIKPIQEKRAEIISNKRLILDIIAEGNTKAKKAASITMQEVREAIFGGKYVL